MTIRTRMTLWYSGVLLLSAFVVAALCFKELHEQHDQTEDPADTSEDIISLLAWVGLPAILLSIGGGWWLMRKAFAPVTALSRAAAALNERTLKQSLPRTLNGDELDQLAEVLNAMTARLDDSFKRIRDFTLHASHELKTPLTILCGEAETELRDDNITSTQRERVASRLDELRRLARIVDGLTLLAKADAGLISLTLKPLAVADLVRDSFADTKLLGQASGLTVELTACEELTVRGDAHRLRQLLLNLADNAVKYNQPGGAVTMGLRRTDGFAQFTITNTGPGIGLESLPRVFDRFYRGDPAHSHSVEGCGLGLSIARWIVSAHNGDIRITSVPSKLTTVTVQLPIVRENQSA